MKVYGLINSNCNEGLKITIADDKSDEKIISFNKSLYASTINGDWHLYDGRDVVWWEIKDGELFIYID